MDKKYQVFISSTYKDLIEQRNQVVEVVLRLSHLPVGMEIFNAASATPWDVIKSHIDNSDYYVLILAHRYGSEDPETGIGYTEKEYDYAISLGIPCLAFVLQDGVHWNPEFTEQKPGPKKKLAAFKKKVHVHHLSYWTSTEDLASKVLLSLVDETRNKPGIGWVRANAVTSNPAVAEELSRLSKENSDLKNQLASIDNQPDELSTLNNFLDSNSFTVKDNSSELSFTFKSLFLAVCKTQSTTPYTSKIAKNLLLISGLREDDIKSTNELFDGLNELANLGIVNSEHIPRGSMWHLSELGSRLYARTRIAEI